MIIQLEVEGRIPTVNNMYSRNKAGKRFLSPLHRQFKEKIFICAYAQIEDKSKIPIFKKDTKITLAIRVSFKKKHRDIDNIVKPIQDALKGLIYEDDSQINTLEVIRIDNEKKDRLEIVVCKSPYLSL